MNKIHFPNQIVLGHIAAELCQKRPNKLKIKELCEATPLSYTEDVVELMSLVLAEISRAKTDSQTLKMKYKSRNLRYEHEAI